jgi:hypothetical protein
MCPVSGVHSKAANMIEKAFAEKIKNAVTAFDKSRQEHQYRTTNY